jgi:Transposase, Mutator family
MAALTQKVRGGGRVVQVAVVIANGVNADGQREILGLDLITTEDGAGWLGFLRSLVARGLHGSSSSSPTPTKASSTRYGHPARRGLAALPHPLCEQLRAKTPKHAWPMVAGMVRSVFEQPDAEAVHRQYRELCAALDGKFDDALALLEAAETDVLALHRLSRRTLEADPIQQPTRAPEQGDTAPHRCRRHLPRPRRRDPPRRRRPRRATRGMGLRTPLHQRRIASQNKAVSHRRRRPPRTPTGGDPRTQRSAVT